MKLPVSPTTAKNSTVKNSDKSPAARRDSVQSVHASGNGYINGSKHLSDARLSPTSSRNFLEAKTTARKSIAARRPTVPSVDSKTTSDPNQNGHAPWGSAITALGPRGPLRDSRGDVRPRKKQRLITPSSEEPSSRPANSASPLARPTGFGFGKANGDIAPPPRLPTLSNDLVPSLPAVAESAALKNKPKSTLALSSYDDYLHRSASPILARLGHTDVSNLIGPTVGPTIIPTNGYDADSSSRDTSRHVSVEIRGDPKTPNTNNSKPLPDAHMSEKSSSQSVQPIKTVLRPHYSPKVPRSESVSPVTLPSTAHTLAMRGQIKRSKVEKSDASRSSNERITRTPPLEQLRRRLAEQRKKESTTLDAYIYGQSNSQPPPSGVVIQYRPAPPKVIPVETAYAIPMDPRTRVNQSHSEEWYRQKEEEIAARGGRKANLGQAAQRLTEQLRNEADDLESFKETLPDRVRNDETWAAAAYFFRGQMRGKPVSAPPQPPPAEVATPVRKKRKYVFKTRNQPAAPPPPASGGKNPPQCDAT